MRPWGVVLALLLTASFVGGLMKSPSEPSSKNFLTASVQAKITCPNAKCKKKNPATNNSCEFCGTKLPKPLISTKKWQGVEMIRVPAGEFTMGSNDEDREKPIRTVYLDEYWIGKTEVTVAQFRKYCQAKPYAYDWTRNKPKWGWIDVHPMVYVNWQEARAFCKWAGGDLPTEAQWEKAARGTDGRKYPWGSKWDSDKLYVNYSGSGDPLSTAPVGSFPQGAGPYGCLDLAGSVWEWCLDWYADKYAAAAKTNPKGPEIGQYRSKRGGSYDEGFGFNGSYRSYDDTSYRNRIIGFRLSGK